ncbi:hypothetical protein RRG08_054944 [Elysia crispata]|uniref:Uncharacterized protein n=1 Tax=Elysia crispata TaxID=231223 RepID=A0AAE1D756_9GAST|nr:hypothetical protein RRG08_054944 [Elysia crispata]
MKQSNVSRTLPWACPNSRGVSDSPVGGPGHNGYHEMAHENLFPTVLILSPLGKRTRPRPESRGLTVSRVADSAFYFALKALDPAGFAMNVRILQEQMFLNVTCT